MSRFEEIASAMGNVMQVFMASLGQVKWEPVVVPAPPEGGFAEGYSGELANYRVLIVHFHSEERDGYDGTLVRMVPTLVLHIHPDQRKAIFDAAKQACAPARN